MSDRSFNLAIETSTARGSIALGRGDALLETIDLVQTRRHNLELMPAIDRLCRTHGATPKHLDEAYVSIGPGSFTGLRIAVATVKMLALALPVRIVAVPTMEAVVRNVPPRESPVAVCMNAKRQHRQMYAGIYRYDRDDWRLTSEPALLTPEELCAQTPGPIAVFGEHLPEFAWPTSIRVLDPALATPRADTIWRLGRAMAEKGPFSDPWSLVPLYVRRPEVEEKQESSKPGNPKIGSASLPAIGAFLLSCFSVFLL